MPEEEFDMSAMFRAAMETPDELLMDEKTAAEKKELKIEVPIDLDAGVWTKEHADKLLKKNSFPLKIISEKTEPNDTLPETYNEQQGIIIFANDEGFFAIPSSIQAHSLLESAKYTKDTSIEVPDLNNTNNWQDKRKFDQWKGLMQQVVDGSL